MVGATNNNSLSNNLILGITTGETPEITYVDEGTTDGQWQLALGSPGIGAGIGGVDVGAFGGPNPYVLSGIPNLPAIYHFVAPAIGSTQSGLQVELKAKGNN